MASSTAESEKIFKHLVRQFGEPCYFNDDEKLTGIGENFWAGLYAAESTVIHDPNESAFYRYNETTGLYEPISEDLIKKEISARILKVRHECNLLALDAKRTNAKLNSIVSQLKGICEKRFAFEKKENYVHIGNGIILFETNGDVNLYNFSPDFYSRNKCPIEFDEAASCPKFNEFLNLAVPLEDSILIQKYVGVCLLGKNVIQKILILDGLPGSGKSTLALIISNLVGLVNVTELRTKHLSDRFEISRFLKKSLLTGVDVPGNFLSEKGTYYLKGLTGGDLLDAEVKGSNGSFQVKGEYCVIITSNTKLSVQLDGDVGAWRRRLLIVEFKGPLPNKKIPNFAEKLIREEGPGILNWALEGLLLVLNDITKHKDISLTVKQRLAIDKLLATSDSLCEFLHNCVTKKEGACLTVAEITMAYQEYCKNQGWLCKSEPVVHKELAGLMQELFGVSRANSINVEGKDVRGFRNVAFKIEEDFFDAGH